MADYATASHATTIRLEKLSAEYIALYKRCWVKVCGFWIFRHLPVIEQSANFGLKTPDLNHPVPTRYNILNIMKLIIRKVKKLIN